MRKENENVFCRWVEEVWNSGRENAIEELFDINGVADYPYPVRSEPIRGVAHFREFFRKMQTFFTKIEMTIEQIASDGNKVVAVCTFAAHRRRFGKDDLLPQEPIKVSGLWKVSIENGKIIHLWNNLELFGTTKSME